EPVEKVVDSEADPGMLFSNRKTDPAQYLEVRGKETRISQRIARPNELAELVNRRVWKPRVNIQHRRDCQFPGRGNFTPGQDAIGGIKVQASTLIWLNHGLGIIAKKLIEVVQVSESFRMRIRRI